MFWPRTDPLPKNRTPRHIRCAMAPSTMSATFEVMRRTMARKWPGTHHAAHAVTFSIQNVCSYWSPKKNSDFTSARIIGYARSVVREGVWSLTEFFVLPGTTDRASAAHCSHAARRRATRSRKHALNPRVAAFRRRFALYPQLACFPGLPIDELLSGPAL